MASPDNPCHRIISTDKCDLHVQTGKNKSRKFLENLVMGKKGEKEIFPNSKDMYTFKSSSNQNLHTNIANLSISGY